MRTHTLEPIGSTTIAMLAGWLAATLGLFAAARQRQRRSRSFGDGGERPAEFEPYAVWGRRHLRQENEDPHAEWLGAGGAA